MTVNKIRIESLSLASHIGVSDKERSNIQTLVCTLELAFDFLKCVESDNIQDTINYAEVSEFIKILAKESSFHLLESLAAYLTNAVLEKFHPLEVRIWLTKKIEFPPLSVTIEYSSTR